MGRSYFCAGGTLKTNQPLSTAVSSELISKMIKNSDDAGSIVVVLDCCYSGAFKGGAVIADSLKGSGRYILASTTDHTLTGDARADGLPSPFTRVVIEGLMSGAEDVNCDGIVDLDDLMRYINSMEGKSQFQPTRKFDGSGEVAIARRQPKDLLEQSQPTNRPENGKVSESLIRAPSGSNEGRSSGSWWLHRRSPGDVSVADIRLWISFSILGIVAFLAAVVSSKNWPRVSPFEESYLQLPQTVWIPAMVISGLLIGLSVAEGMLTRKLDVHSVPRRIIVSENKRPVLRFIRGVRDVVLLLSALLYAPPLIFFENYSISWMLCLSAIGCAILIAVVRRINFGDAMFLGGILLAGIALILPDFSRGAIDQSSTVIPIAALSLLAAGLWYLRAPRGVAITTCLLGVFFSMLGWANTGFGPGEASLVALVGFAVSAVAMGLGASEPLGDRV